MLSRAISRRRHSVLGLSVRTSVIIYPKSVNTLSYNPFVEISTNLKIRCMVVDTDELTKF